MNLIVNLIYVVIVKKKENNTINLIFYQVGRDDKILKVFSVCAGIGAFEKALKRQNIDYELIGFSEVDKWAIQSYCLIHDESEDKNLGNISEINEKELPIFDLLVGGTPCTNISKVGNLQGIQGNESKLFYDYARILNHCLPKYFVFENVDNLLTINKGKDWEIVKYHFELNYNIYYKILNAKDYGIPQSRKRLLVVGIRKELEQIFSFPNEIGCDLWFKEFLEPEVDPKYYLSQRERIYMDRETKDGRNHWDFQHYHNTNSQFSHCIVANTFKGVPYNVLVNGEKCKFNFYDCDFIDDEDSCVMCQEGDCFQLNNNVTSGIRKLTPLETCRLMNFDDEDYYIMKNNKLSNTQMYKMFGNSIIVKILELIFNNLLTDE